MSTLRMLLEPASLSLLVVAVAAGALARRRGGRLARVGRLWVGVWVAAYVLMSLPAVTRVLNAGLAPADAPIRTSDETRGRAALVLLTGSARVYRTGETPVAMLDVVTALRVAEATRVFRLMDAPLVLVSGGGDDAERTPAVVAMRAALIASGVPAERILLESASRNTRSSAIAVRGLLESRGIGRAVLVTSAHHVPRALGAFRAEGVDMIASPAPMLPQRWGRGVGALLPDLHALSLSAYCAHEYAGLAYYRLRGWL